jgi:hypothetical protein
MMLECKVRHFSYGAVFGSRVFVERQLEKLKELFGYKRDRKPIELKEHPQYYVIRAVRERTNN